MSYVKPVPSVVLLEEDACANAQAGAALLDDPQEWPAFGRELAQRAQVWDSQVVLEGMHCAACALTIEEALGAVPGVERVEVSSATRRARVVWQADKVRPSVWMAAVEKAGYRALPAMDTHARELRRAEQRTMLWRWLVAGFCMMQVMMYAWPAYVAQPGDLSLEMETLLRWASWVISVPVVLFACGPFFANALRDIRQRRISMDLPVALGMLITFVVSTAGTFDPTGRFGREVFFDSLTMFVFFLLSGRFLELRLRERTAGALEAVMNRLPESVLRRKSDGLFERISTRRVREGDVLQILAGDAFPADGRILEGHTQVDEALLTGESTPLARGPGEAVTAGSFNLSAPVLVAVQTVGEGTRFAQICALMESASLQKPRLAQLADRIARPFLVAVLLAAAFAAAWWWPQDPSHAMMVAVAVLIVTCPCALSLATPVAMLTAAGTLARQGVLVRNLQALESLASVDTLVFDKTGTLTRDALVVQAIHAAQGIAENQALSWAAALASQSLHPVARAVAAAAHGRQNLPTFKAEQLQEIAGQGLCGIVDGRTLRLGSTAFTQVTQATQVAPGLGPVVVLSEQIGQQWQERARFALQEDVRADAAQVVRTLHQLGVGVLLLSGDTPASVENIAQQVGISQARGACTPQDKLTALQALQEQGRRVAMVGDGLNDGPVLAAAHASFAFGQAVPLAQSRADFAVPDGQLQRVAQTLALARKTMAIVRQNLAWAALYNALTVPLAIAGFMPAWLAGLGMALSSLLVVANAARLARTLAPLPTKPIPPVTSAQSDDSPPPTSAHNAVEMA